MPALYSELLHLSDSCNDITMEYKPITPVVGQKYRVLKMPIIGGNAKVGEVYTLIQKTHSQGNLRWATKETDWFLTGAHEMMTTEYLELVEGTERTTAYRTGESPIEKDIKKTIKQKAMSIYRKARMSKDEKTLYEAGYMNQDGTPTTKGQEASDFVNWKENQKELVTMAKEELEDKG